jgi:hypothetical protein
MCKTFNKLYAGSLIRFPTKDGGGEEGEGKGEGEGEASHCTPTVLHPHSSVKESGSLGDEILPTAYSGLGGKQ